MRRGLRYAYIAALVSGFSIFINTIVVKKSPNPFVFSTAKNVTVALALALIVIFSGKLKIILKLTKKSWLKLIFLGLVGGSVPFMLFFYGLSITSAPDASALIQKTIFVWVSVFSLAFFKEKLSKIQLASLMVIALGIFLSAGGGAVLSFGRGEFYVFLATLLWSAEMIYIKKYLIDFDTTLLVFSRMFFGAVFMLGYLLFMGDYRKFAAFTMNDILGIIITSAFLLAYVFYLYRAIKSEKPTVVSAILTIAFPVTISLNNVFLGRPLLNSQINFLFVLLGVSLMIFAIKRDKLRWTV